MTDKETPRSVARKVLDRPEILNEVLILMAWTEPERLEDIQQMIAQVKERKQNFLAACSAGTFGRDYIYPYTPEDAAQLWPIMDRRWAAAQAQARQERRDTQAATAANATADAADHSDMADAANASPNFTGNGEA